MAISSSSYGFTFPFISGISSAGTHTLTLLFDKPFAMKGTKVIFDLFKYISAVIPYY
jgi:hypothetical protein